MKLKFGVLVVAIAICIGYSAANCADRGKKIEDVMASGVAENENLALIPGVDGGFELADLNKEQNIRHKRANPDVEYVEFHLFINNPMVYQNIPIGKVAWLAASTFNPNNPTSFLIHGWGDHPSTLFNRVLRKAFADNCDCNIFVVNWEHVAAQILYPSVVRDLHDVATKIADFIDYLYLNGSMKFKDLTLVGHSLRAHLAGITGKKVKYGKIAVIIGLDPTGPEFSLDDKDNRISTDDAEYVQIIHTYTYLLGFSDPIGHGDFYPNTGVFQPACGFDILGMCSHERSFDYYGESLYSNNSFIPYECEKYADVDYKKCPQVKNEYRMGGDPADYNYPKGIFYVPISDKPTPYAVGLNKF